MKKIVILLMSVFFLAACSNEDSVNDIIIDEEEKEEAIDTDIYVFENIQYYYEDVNDLQISTYKDSTIYINGSEKTIEIFMKPNETVLRRTSQFFPNEKPDVNFEINDLPKISIPHESFKDSFNYRIGTWFSISGLEEWKYSEEKEELPYSGSTTTGKTGLPPHTKIYALHEYEKYDLTALYEATFIGEKSGKKIKVSGRWKGQWYSLSGVTTGELNS